jgi:hypothetical protein
MRFLLPLALLPLIVAVGVAAGARPAAPAAPAACPDGGDRAAKLALLERLPRNPQILILGSSRAREADPSFLQRLTGERGFNGAVTGGTAADAWVTVRLAASRFPHASRHYLLFVDPGIATNGVNPALAAEPLARRYLGTDARPGSVDCRANSRYRADGSIAHQSRASAAAKARTVARTAGQLIAAIRAHPPRPGTIDPRRYTYFERTIAFLNRQGVRPVIVINPIYPTVLAELKKYGFPKRRAAAAYLAQLHKRLEFVVVDCEDIRSWGGSASHFSNATHVDAVNMRRMLRFIVAHSDGALVHG